MAPRPLTPKQEKFARLYVELGNASEAYRQAYSVAPNRKAERVHVDACELLAHPKVSRRVEELNRAAAAKHEVTAERIIGELARIAFADLAQFVHVSEDGDVRINFEGAAKAKTLGALSEFSQEVFWEKDGTDGVDQIRRTKFKLHDKIRALELLGKRLRLWVDRVEEVERITPADLPALTAEEARAIDAEIDRLLH